MLLFSFVEPNEIDARVKFRLNVVFMLLLTCVQWCTHEFNSFDFIWLLWFIRVSLSLTKSESTSDAIRIFTVLTDTSWQEDTARGYDEGYEGTAQSPNAPYFDLANTTVTGNNVTVIGVVGRSVQLKCKVQNLGNKTVNWKRISGDTDSIWFEIQSIADIVDQASRYSHIDCGRLHIHIGSAFQGNVQSVARRMHTRIEVDFDAWRRRLRMSNIHAAGPQSLLQFKSCRWV